jgi:AcrR family transcriptional regulator
MATDISAQRGSRHEARPESRVDARLDRREAILAAARGVLAEKGLEAAKISDIVARAGVAQGTFYLYFPSKLSLVLALAEDMNTRLLASVRRVFESTPSLSAAIQAAVVAAFRELERYKDVLGILHSRMGIADFYAECKKLDEPAHAFVAEMIRAAQAAGQMAPAVNPTISAQLIVGLLEHAAHACFVLDVQQPTDAYIAEVVRFIRDGLGVVA